MKQSILSSKAALLAAGFLAAFCTSLTTWAGDSARPEISFTVHKLLEKNVEGPDIERTFFWAGGKRMIFGLPKGFRLSGGDGFLLLPAEPGSFDGEIRVNPSPFTPDSDLAKNALLYRDAAAKDMPQGAIHVQVQQPVLNPYPYNGWKSIGFTWTYSHYGRQMARTVSYINLEIGTQIVVTTLAEINSADKVDKIARQFMSSWWVMSDDRVVAQE